MCLCDFSDVLNLPDYCDVTRNFNVWHVLQFQSFLTFILIGFGKKNVQYYSFDKDSNWDATRCSYFNVTEINSFI